MTSPRPNTDATPTAAYSPFLTQENGRYTTGTLLMGRYRIVAALGQGGMGEVYRADDLTLGQPVALKFLPEHFADDADRLARFRHEVALARRVSHPHACRVYDIGDCPQGEGKQRTFLSMEFIDGEDLECLLKRVGRLPEEKGIEIARQLCAGLGSVHEQGLLHRDLKPANVMLDGRGKVRLTDFGLAATLNEASDIRSGTPAYQAPEQFVGKEVTLQSDLFSLGLVLYEVFTGKKAFPHSAAGEAVPSKPTSHVNGLDPVIEKVLLHCLEREPKDRPRSVFDVLAALPGGDPLQAALAAGETPSPALVAAAGGNELMLVRRATQILAVVLVFLGSLPFLLKNRPPASLLWPDKSPEVLASDAKRILRQLGYNHSEDEPGDSAFGFERNPLTSSASKVFLARDSSYLNWMHAPLRFWYRQGPHILTPSSIWGTAPAGTLSMINPSSSDPSPMKPGMVTLQTDMHGRLLAFLAVPLPLREPLQQAVQVPDWYGLLNPDLLGFNLRELTSATETTTPPVAFDAVVAWEGVLPNSNLPIRVEASAYRGRLVHLSLRPLKSDNGEPRSDNRTLVSLAIRWLILIVSIVLALRHLRSGQADYSGAAKLAMLVLLAYLVGWYSTAPFRPDVAHLLSQALAALVIGVFLAVRNSCFYLALEPLVRRFWPESLTSWSRALAGRFRDPLVGQHVLYGFLAATVLFGVFRIVSVFLSEMSALSMSRPVGGAVGQLPLNLSYRSLLLPFVYALLTSFHGVLSFFMVMLLLRMVCSNARLATAGAYIVLPLYHFTFSSHLWAWLLENPISLAGNLGFTLTVVFLATRFGFLPTFAFFFVSALLESLPFTSDMQAWYAGTGTTVLVVLALTAVYLAHIATGRRLFVTEGNSTT